MRYLPIFFQIYQGQIETVKNISKGSDENYRRGTNELSGPSADDGLKVLQPDA